MKSERHDVPCRAESRRKRIEGAWRRAARKCFPRLISKDQAELLLFLETAQQRVTLHRGTEIAEIAQIS